MATRITCPHCGQDLRLPVHLRDGPAQCPYCEGAFAIRWPQQPRSAAEAGAPLVAPNEKGRLPCRFCGKPIMPGAVKCRWCGKWLEESGRG